MSHTYSSVALCICKTNLILIILLVGKGWNKQHQGQTIHPTEKFTSMIFSKFFALQDGHNHFWPLRFWRLLRGQKHPSEAKNGMKELIYWKKYVIKFSQQPQKPLPGSIQIWFTTSGKKVMIFEATNLHYFIMTSHKNLMTEGFKTFGKNYNSRWSRTITNAYNVHVTTPIFALLMFVHI